MGNQTYGDALTNILMQGVQAGNNALQLASQYNPVNMGANFAQGMVNSPMSGNPMQDISTMLAQQFAPSVKKISMDSDGGRAIEFHTPQRPAEALANKTVQPSASAVQSNTQEQAPNEMQETSQGIDFSNLPIGLMMAGRAMQGGNPMEVLTGLMQTKLGQQKFLGQEPIQPEKQVELATAQYQAKTKAYQDAMTNKISQINALAQATPLVVKQTPFINSGYLNQVGGLLDEMKQLHEQYLGSQIGTQEKNSSSQLSKPGKPGQKKVINGKTYVWKE